MRSQNVSASSNAEAWNGNSISKFFKPSQSRLDASARMVSDQPSDQLTALRSEVTGTVERREASGRQLVRVSDVMKICGCDQDVFQIAERGPDLTCEAANRLYVRPPAAQRGHEPLSRPYRPADQIAHPDTLRSSRPYTL